MCLDLYLLFLSVITAAMADVLALAVLGVFYFVVLIWGIAASRWYKSKNLENVTSDEADLLAGRRLGSVVGALTMAGW